jgi:hypothetical protein
MVEWTTAILVGMGGQRGYRRCRGEGTRRWCISQFTDHVFDRLRVRPRRIVLYAYLLAGKVHDGRVYAFRCFQALLDAIDTGGAGHSLHR